MVFPLFSICKSKKKEDKKVAETSRLHFSSTAASSSSSSGKSKKSDPNSTHSSGSGNFVILDTAATSGLLCRDPWESSVQNSKSLFSIRESIRSDQAHIFNFQEISAATQNFRLKPHSSSSSSVAWRCNLHNQDVIIFQRRFRRQMDISEIIDRLSIICKSHHSSLVKLKGASISDNYIYLVYDYASGANLASCLRNPRNPQFTVLSNWMSRISIASNIAHGLDYIHNSTGLGMEFVHNHLKSSSIIVSEPELNARICHFGTSDLCGEITSKTPDPKELKRSHSKINKVEGTRGYMALEFQNNGIISQKCDIYAFGVVILELLSGMEALKYNIDENTGNYVRISVVDTGRNAIQNGGGGGIRNWVDKRLRDSYPVEVAEKLVKLALECVADDPCRRPEMERIVTMISHMFLESQNWAQGMNMAIDMSSSLAPR